jgi:hypothetical protein
MERIDVELNCTHDIVIKYGVAECQNCGLEESKISKQLTDLEIAIKLEEIERKELKAERMYSEEDLRKAFNQGQENVDYNDTYGWSSKLTEQEWFEQFSKLKNG